ncbi:MarR family transcriptional regulator [Sphingomonas sp. CGMCC 1.13654]|uniref:MarR family transcriptional regulator n=1 Tax=Sphingomonas chungangi TaxID=2683589 RepID=A0A838L0P2_9SPHN|nr:MarR family transcriptional regulator [Sphingomonas chungangi]MVW56240.1 MarR family transcriptional regulator [Sphingomonas chungangi]
MAGRLADQADYDRAGDAMRDFYQRSHRLIDRIMTAQGASFARARILKLVSLSGSLRSIDLASSFGYAPRTVTEAIDALERDGLVRRDPDPEDRRAKRISLTPAGEKAVEAAEGSRLEYMQSVFGVLSAEECDEIVRVVGKLNARLLELGG